MFGSYFLIIQSLRGFAGVRIFASCIAFLYNHCSMPFSNMNVALKYKIDFYYSLSLLIATLIHSVLFSFTHSSHHHLLSSPLLYFLLFSPILSSLLSSLFSPTLKHFISLPLFLFFF